MYEKIINFHNKSFQGTKMVPHECNMRWENSECVNVQNVKKEIDNSMTSPSLEETHLFVLESLTQNFPDFLHFNIQNALAFPDMQEYGVYLLLFLLTNYIMMEESRNNSNNKFP